MCGASKSGIAEAHLDAEKSRTVEASVEEEWRGDRPSLRSRMCSRIEVGGVRQCLFTLVQTSLGGGLLAIPSAMQMTGLGLGLAMLVFNGVVLCLGVEVVMRGAIRMEVKDTAALLAKCVGKWSGPGMDLLLVLYANGAIITFFILLGDFVPAIVSHMVALSWLPPFSAPFGWSMRTASIVASLLIAIPMCVPSKLSALRYLSPLPLMALMVTAVTIITKFPANFEAHIGKPSFGDINWATLNWNFFKAYGILLFVCNCHLNVVPVVSEMKQPSITRIQKVSFRVPLILITFYAMIAAGGYLSHLAHTRQNILTNYPTESPEIILSMALMCCTVLVGIPTFVNPSARSLRCFLRVLRLPMNPALRLSQVWSPLHQPQGEMTAALLAAVQDESMDLIMVGDDVDDAKIFAQEGGGSREVQKVRACPVKRQPTHEQIGVVQSEVVRLALTALCLVADVSVAMVVKDVGDIGGFVGAFAGTALVVGMPLAVLLTLRTREFSRMYFLVATCILSLAALLACCAVVVMPLQAMGILEV